jgi:DNA-binding beta-propeller fold protein YncE
VTTQQWIVNDSVVGTDALVVFSRDPVTGALARIPGTAGCFSDGDHPGCTPSRGLRGANGIAVGRDGATLDVTSEEGVASFRRDPNTGALAQVPGPTGCITRTSQPDCARGRLIAGSFESGRPALSADGRYLYVIADRPSGIGVLRRAPASGGLRQPAGMAGCLSQRRTSHCTRVPMLNFPAAIALSPGGRHLYVASQVFVDGTLQSFTRDPRSGRLRRIRGRSGCLSEKRKRPCRHVHALGSPNDLVVAPDGRTVYSASYGVNAVTGFARNRTTGTLSQGRSRATCVSEQEPGPPGTVIDRRCRTGRAINPAALAISPDGRRVYAARIGAIAVLRREPRGGFLSQSHGRSGCFAEGDPYVWRRSRCDLRGRAIGDLSDLALSPDGAHLYAVSRNDYDRSRADGIVVLSRSPGP